MIKFQETRCSRAPEPRLYNANAQCGQVRRNRSQLRERNTTVHKTKSLSGNEPKSMQTCSQAGVTLRSPSEHYMISLKEV